MKKPLVGVLALALYACDSLPSPTQAESALRARIDDGMADRIKLTNFRKTDGQSSEVARVSLYQMAFDADLEFLADVYYSGSGTSLLDDTYMADGKIASRVIAGPPPTCAANIYYCVNPAPDVGRKGQSLHLRGKIAFEKSESGWHSTGVTFRAVEGPATVETNRSQLDEVARRNESGTAGPGAVSRAILEPSPSTPQRSATVAMASRPPAPLRQIDPCLMYKCGGDPIRLKKSTRLFEQPDMKSNVVEQGSSGVEYTPDNMAVVTLKPGIYEVTESFSLPNSGSRLKPGDRIYTYHHWGEGCFTAWISGKLYGYAAPKEPTKFVSGRGNGCVTLLEHVRELEGDKSEFWLRVPLNSGKKAWLQGDTAIFEWIS
jgi:hypothetical protein